VFLRRNCSNKENSFLYFFVSSCVIGSYDLNVESLSVVVAVAVVVAVVVVVVFRQFLKSETFSYFSKVSSTSENFRYNVSELLHTIV
jgi:hypothetical protein